MLANFQNFFSGKHSKNCTKIIIKVSVIRRGCRCITNGVLHGAVISRDSCHAVYWIHDIAL